MWTDGNLITINDSDPYTAPDGTKYPGNFPKAQIPGLIPVLVPPAPSTEGQVITGASIQNINGTYTQIYQTQPLSSDQIAQAKASANLTIINQIQQLELTQQRALRQVALGNGAVTYKNGVTLTPVQFLANTEAQIVTLRTQLQ